MLSKLKYEKKRRHILFGLGLFAVFTFAVVNLVSMQIEITQKREEYNEIQKQLEETYAANEQLERYSSDEHRMEYIEQIARDSLDYSYGDESIYYFIPK